MIGLRSFHFISPRILAPATKVQRNLHCLSSRNFPSSLSAYRLNPSFCVNSAAGPSLSVVKTKDEFSESLVKVKTASAHAVYYFTAAWCGPCRFISPFFEELCLKYPHVLRYKIDIDQEGLSEMLQKLQISSVPTFHFYKEGNKIKDLIGADVQQLKNIMESLYQ